MLNQSILVGRIAKDAEITELEDGRKVTELTLAVNRSYKNAEGIYETDFINCVLWNGIAENVIQYCKKGDLVGVKGRLETQTEVIDNDLQVVKTVLIAEKVTFLSSKKEKNEENNEDDEE